MPVTNGIALNGNSNSVTINTSYGNQFYCLVAP
jgi:hypothetical protein